MPTYIVTDPKTNRELELTGDSPPTEQELKDIFGQVGSSKTQEGEGLLSKIQAGQERVKSLQYGGRPDVLSQFAGDAKESYNDLSNPSSPKDLIKAHAGFPVTAAKLALEGAGGLIQRGVAALSNPVTELQAGRQDEAIPSIGRGLKGGQLGESGDILRSLGASETTSALGGLAMEGAIPGPKQAGAVVKAGRQAMEGLGERLATSGFKGAKKLSLQAMLGKNEEEARRLVETGFKDINKHNLRPNDAAAQELGNTLIAKTRKLVYEPAKKAFTKLEREVSSAPISQQTSRNTAATLQNMLDQELDTAVANEIRNTPLTKITEEITSPTKTTKTTRVVTSTETPVQKIMRKEVERGQTSARTVEQHSEKIISEFPTKYVEQSVTQEGGKTLRDRTLTIGEVINRAAAGEPISAKDWIGVQRLLAELGQSNVRASRMATASGNILRNEVPQLDEALTKWQRWSQAQDHLNTLVGGIVKQGGPRGDLYTAANGGKLTDFLKNPAGSKEHIAATQLQDILNETGKTVPDYLDQIKGVAASAGMGSPKPRLASVSIGGGVLGAATYAGVPKPVAAAAFTVLLGESIPRVSGQSGKILSALLSSDSRVRKLLNSPMAEAIKQGNMLSNKERSAVVTGNVLRGAGNVIDQGIARQLTGRNEEQ